VSDAREAGGKFSATYTPPKETYPQVAIVRAEITEAGNKRNVWSAVPIYGVHTVKLTTKPLAKVELQIGELRFQSDVSSDSKGHVEIPVQVPPGIDAGKARSVDRLGNKAEKPVQLEPPDFARARLAPAGRDAVASWADEKALALEIYAVKRDGSQAGAEVTPVLEVDRGTLDPVRLIRPGLWQSAFRAPPKVGNGKAIVHVRLKERGRVLPDFSTLEIAVHPGNAKRIELSAATPEVRADQPTVKLTAVGFDERDNAIGPADEVTSDFGAVKTQGEGFVLEVPPSFEARTNVTITARSGRATATLQLPLKPGIAAKGAMSLPKTKVRAGAEPLRGTLELRDARGNPVNGANVQFASDLIKGEVERELGEGRYAVNLVPDDEARGGETQVEVRVPDAPLKLSVPVTVLPALKPGSVTAGAWLGGRSNFGKVLGGGVAAEIGVLPARIPLEALLTLGVATFAPVQQTGATQVEAKFTALNALVGARFSVPLGAFTAIHFTAQGGVQRVSQTLSIPDVPLTDAPSLLTPIARAAVGLSYRMGPGRLGVELGYGFERVKFTPDTSSTNAATRSLPEVQGNLGGVQLSVGYIVQLF
ncbi:MAG: hypothetical protein ACJ790_10070, partial [Myxococcaceae bacterium]